MKDWPIGLKVGILGGGQLARMLAQAAQQLGLSTHIFCQSGDEPAAQVCAKVTLGSPTQKNDLQKFLNGLDMVTFESEFFDIELLREALGAIKNPPRLFPDPDIMQSFQDRRSQKQWLLDAKLPTAAFIAVNAAADLDKAWALFPKGFVFKKARGGYDGNGTHYIRSLEQLSFQKKNFLSAGVAEELISFRRELAVVAVCGDKNIEFMPLVETRQKDSRCDWVLGPSSHPAWPKLALKIKIALKKQGYRGVVAFEFFEVGTKLLINEIAPRVHNSGHYSQQALLHSQFDLHWMAGLGGKISPAQLLKPAFVMTNLVGESDQHFIFPNDLKGHLHWYGKSSNRLGRKMGHMNYVGSSGKALLKSALAERKKIEK